MRGMCAEKGGDYRESINESDTHREGDNEMGDKAQREKERAKRKRKRKREQRECVKRDYSGRFWRALSGDADCCHDGCHNTCQHQQQTLLIPLLFLLCAFFRFSPASLRSLYSLQLSDFLYAIRNENRQPKAQRKEKRGRKEEGWFPKLYHFLSSHASFLTSSLGCCWLFQSTTGYL